MTESILPLAAGNIALIGAVIISILISIIPLLFLKFRESPMYLGIRLMALLKGLYCVVDFC